MRSRLPILLLPPLMLLASACVSHRAPSTTPRSDVRAETGIASWYGKRFHGKRTASGEVFDMNELTAAHRTLAFGSIVRVTVIPSGETVDVRINDRGPADRSRIIDLSYAAARKLNMVRSGLARVQVQVIERPRARS